MVRRAVTAGVLVALMGTGAASAGLLSSGRHATTTTWVTSGTTCVTPLPDAGGGATAATTATATGVTATVAAPATTPAGSATTLAATSSTTTRTGTGAATTSLAVATTTAAAATTSTAPCGLPATTATAATTTTPAPPAIVASTSASTLVLSGHGYGHGMGMSQWGAYGYASHGWDATQILGHYYPGTTIGLDPAPTVRVLLSADHALVRLASASTWKVRDGAGTAVALPAAPLVLHASLQLDGRRLVSPLSFTPGASPVEVAGRSYRGSLLVVSNGTSLQVINEVGMEQYLEGVVGAEMPASWPAAALEAQAIAARSYALAQLENVVTASPFDLYSDGRSQVYGGIAAESPAVTQAVASTAREVVLYGGHVATTYYSASSGGETVSAAEAIGTAVPYLVSVADPYDTLSPFHDWGPLLIGAARAGRSLGLSGPLLGLQTVSGPSLHVATVTAVGADGSVTLPGTEVEADLGLPSTWFQVAWLSLSPPPAPLAVGQSAVLSGVVRGLSDVQLQTETADLGWQPLESVVPGSGGSFTITVSPTTTTRYRLVTGRIAGAEITIRVVPVLTARLSPAGIQGTVSPAVAGESVMLQRESGNAWATTAVVQTGPAGAYVLAGPFAAGSYRVRSAAAGHLGAATSARLLVGG